MASVWCLPAGLVLYAPTTIKKFATGDGRASKEQMQRAYRTQFKSNPIDDNEADARFVLEMARQGIPGRHQKKAAARKIRKQSKKEPRLFK